MWERQEPKIKLRGEGLESRGTASSFLNLIVSESGFDSQIHQINPGRHFVTNNQKAKKGVPHIKMVLHDGLMCRKKFLKNQNQTAGPVH